MGVNAGSTVGVVVVSFRSEDVIVECLETLVGSTSVRLKVVVVDNDSPDGSCDTIKRWASGEAPFVQPPGSPLPKAKPTAKPLPLRDMEVGEPVGELGLLTLIRSDVNLGFAGGVNVGLRALAGQVDWYWVLNPDCVVPPDAARGFVEAAKATPNFSLMTSRTVYYATPDRIQTDGGQVSRLTGTCRQRGYGASVEAPRPEAAELDWITGANMFVSPAFVARAGLMPEDYFLYYEEVDWAYRRGDMPLAIARDTVVYHHGGTTIGSGTIDRRPSPFANYFNHRNRIRFAKRFLSRWPLGAYLFGFAKALQLLLGGARSEAYAVVAGMLELRPPAEIANRFPDPRAARLALGRSAS